MKWLNKLHDERNPVISVIVPTLNEEAHVSLLLNSVGHQASRNYEVLIIDGGSKDETPNIGRYYDARVIVMPGQGEFISRNIGAKTAKGDYLMFTCADVIFPPYLFRRVVQKFEEDRNLIALTGPGYPFDAPIFGKIEYAIYNLMRYAFAKLPHSIKRFSTSTNFLVVRKDYFEKTGGFLTNDINADGLMGKRLLQLGEVAFCLDMPVYMSARRMKNMGFVNFNKHYLYALENFFFFTSKIDAVQSWKHRSRSKHRKMHETQE